MSKEQLEEIKHDYRNTEFASRFFTSLKNIDWLIKQAERVQELEEVVKNNFKHYKHQQEMIFELEQQNKYHREVIEQVKDNIPLEFNHGSEYEAKKNVLRLISINNVTSEALEESNE